MKGRIVTAGQERYDLPELYTWELCCTGSVPCDSFEIGCGYDAAMLPILETACRFEALEDGEVIFRGVVDEYGVTSSESGLALTLRGRGMAALLLDNETEAATYQRATLGELLRRHAEPYGIEVEMDGDIAAQEVYKVAGGSSEWKALSDFTRQFGGYLPRFTKLGVLRLAKGVGGRALALSPQAAILSASWREKRYGVVSKVTVISRGGALRQDVVNEEFSERGGQSRRVLYSTAGDPESMRAAGKYKIEQSCAEEKILTLEIAGSVAAEPFDVIEATLPALGIAGAFRVREVLLHMDAAGERTRLKLEEE